MGRKVVTLVFKVNKNINRFWCSFYTLGRQVLIVVLFSRSTGLKFVFFLGRQVLIFVLFSRCTSRQVLMFVLFSTSTGLKFLFLGRQVF